jgi:phosphoribosylformimino-5-aminoimidazole carboxamide ribonucleotide (ProFAR) isomerase
MGDAHVAREVGDALAVLKDIGSHAVALALEYPATRGARRNAARILAAVLQIVETLVQVGGGIGARRVGEDESENAAHVAGLGWM